MPKRSGSTMSDEESKCGDEYTVNQEVLVRWSDGLFYLGHITKVKTEKCLVKFEDNSEFWILYKDIQRGAHNGDIMCCICQGGTSDCPNEIVLCDNCGLGYHQQCHNPIIDKEVLQPEVEFLCRLCVFATTVKKGGALKKGPHDKAFQAMRQSFPYTLENLTWDAKHKMNVEQCYCYCGGPGDWYMKMIQCCRCRQWFHEACVQCLNRPLLFGDKFYMFVCSHCNHGPEYIKRLDLKWTDLTQIAIFNMTVINGRKYYDLYEELLPWIHDNWDALVCPELQFATEKEIEANVFEALQNHKTRFSCGYEIKKKRTWWGLRVRVAPSAPNVILPTDGEITDEVMSNLQMKGRRTKTFIPLQCNSPIPNRHRARGLGIDDSIAFKTTRNGQNNLISLNKDFMFNSQRSNGYCYELKRKRTKRHFSLNKMIPLENSFDGHNHPFKTDLERREEIERHNQLQQRLLDMYQSASETSSQCSDGGESTTVDTQDNASEDSLESSPYFRLRSRKQMRKKRQSSPPPLIMPLQPKRKRSPIPPHPPVLNVISPVAIHAAGKQKVDIQHLKSSVKNYFGAAGRLSDGENFTVLARRTLADGSISHLVEWEGFLL
ncbi:metal-response element-binding transcription factor 2-like isoform X2 [Gigantopelta aegis]|uniref:metal-response element-binding transcription factor 2-like isoform X2 n=1 Tax=Gigantopelta aegis TaxID=1735272 RepID=UPI001B88CAD3|nr:metal-response element-binding transcription factor 2-like isoform X2 [Gigantopelta aegis]